MKEPVILAIESSCDETGVAVLQGRKVLSNVIATQKVHEQYGGVVPELASRAHQQNIVPTIQKALNDSGISFSNLSAIAVTAGPGLSGALLVGVSFAKSLSMGLNVPLIAVDHMKAHVQAHFIDTGTPLPEFPMLCLTVSGGHTQLVLVSSPNELKEIGRTIDDAAGEAFDKAAKVLGLPYPGGPMIDKYSKTGNPQKFKFPFPETPDLKYSFSGLKTSLLYFLRKEKEKNERFIEDNISDICASFQEAVVSYLLVKLKKACIQVKPKSIALAGGVSANSRLRYLFSELSSQLNIPCYIPPIEFTTDNAAMIGISAYFEFLDNKFAELNLVPSPKASL